MTDLPKLKIGCGKRCVGVHGRNVSHADYLVRKNKSRQERPLLRDKERRDRIREGSPVCIRGHQATYDAVLALAGLTGMDLEKNGGG